MHPLREDAEYFKEYVCQIKSYQHIEVRAMEKGYLTDIFVDEGQLLSKGQPMFQVMPLVFQAELNKAEAEVRFADIEYQNTRQLSDQNIVSINELALAKAKLDKAKAELSLAKVHLDLTKIVAPFDGIMDRLEVRLGSFVDEGDLLTKLSDNSKMWAYFNVPEAEYLEYKSNMSQGDYFHVHLRLANNKIFQHEGVVETIVGDFNNETGNIAFRATFPNPDGLLRYGQTGTIRVDIPYENALLIPQKCTFEVLDKKYVYVVDEENKVHSRRIEIAAELPHIYIIEDGLDDHDLIMLEGLRHVRENDEIKYDLVDSKETLANLDLYAE